MTDHPLLAKLFGVASGATAVTFLSALDTVLRIGASIVAIVSGCLCAAVAIRTLRRK